MILAVMTRTKFGHTGRSLSAGRITGLIYMLNAVLVSGVTEQRKVGSDVA